MEVEKIDRIMEIRIGGKLAHFRKFYTNASSLTYTIPPRTSICGILASILEQDRDSYYELFSSDKLGIGIAIPDGYGSRKFFQTMNYAQDKSTKTPINDLSAHKQCRLELLCGLGTNELAWSVFIGFNPHSDPLFTELEARIKEHNLGYGICLGQRQFLAGIEHISTYPSGTFTYLAMSEYIDSAITKDKVTDFDGTEYKICMERMPLEQQTTKIGKKIFRQSSRFGDVMVEQSGKRLLGRFTDVIELKNPQKTRIAFL